MLSVITSLLLLTIKMAVEDKRKNRIGSGYARSNVLSKSYKIVEEAPFGFRLGGIVVRSKDQAFFEGAELRELFYCCGGRE